MCIFVVDMSSASDQLRIALQLVEESRSALWRVPARPGVGVEDIIHRLTAAVDQLGYSQASIPHELRYHALFPAIVPAENEHDLLGTRQSAELQQEGTLGEAAALTRPIKSEFVSQMASLQARVYVAANRATENMQHASADARRALLSM
jgi:hypothetical protein